VAVVVDDVVTNIGLWSDGSRPPDGAEIVVIADGDTAHIGGGIVDGVIVPPSAAMTSLSDTIGNALGVIDRAAEVVREIYLTAGDGQVMAYQTKALEATLLKATLAQGGTPVADHFPHLAAEIGVTAATLADVAEVVSAQAAVWANTSAMIEGTGLSAKAAIRVATSAEEVAGILDNLSWPGDLA
jgi:hypothetical protein